MTTTRTYKRNMTNKYRLASLRYNQFIELWKRLESEYPDLYKFLPERKWRDMARSERTKLNREFPKPLYEYEEIVD
jgi:hypothetical protein